MLYDKRWDKRAKTEADPFTLVNLIAWLEKHPAGKEYCWMDANHCLMGQWLADNGVPSKDIWWGSNDLTSMEPFDQIALSKPYTFGAALERARALQAQS